MSRMCVHGCRRATFSRRLSATKINRKRSGSSLALDKGDETMAYDISLDRFPGELVFSQHTARPRRRLFRRFLAAFMAAQQRRADREIARYIAASGGLTDSVEREIERRFLLNAAGR